MAVPDAGHLKSATRDSAGKGIREYGESWHDVFNRGLKQNSSPGIAIDSFSVAIPAPSGICTDGSSFWIPNYAAFQGNRLIYRISIQTRKIIDSVTSPGSWSTGLALDGSGLWVMDIYPGSQYSIMKLSPTGQILKFFPAAYSCWWAGIAWDGAFLYYGTNICLVPESRQSSMIFKADPGNGARLDSLPPPSGNINGLTFHRDHFWYCDLLTCMIYEMTQKGEIRTLFRAPGGYPSGLAIARGYLWNVDFDARQVYQIDIGLAPSIPTGVLGAGHHGRVQLTWHHNLDSDLLHYKIYRAESGDPAIAECIDSVALSDTSYIDRAIINGQEYHYWVSAADTEGYESHFSKSVLVVPKDTTIPSNVMLYQNYPNPFNSATKIRFALPDRGSVALTVFNPLGQQVATLVQGQEEAGYHEVVFDGTGLSSGVYFYRITAGDYVATKKLLLLK